VVRDIFASTTVKGKKQFFLTEKDTHSHTIGVWVLCCKTITIERIKNDPFSNIIAYDLTWKSFLLQSYINAYELRKNNYFDPFYVATFSLLAIPY
jgi:hypothetical protein